MGNYRDLQLVVRFEGFSCELQLSTTLMLRAKETTGHRDYEVLRELKAAITAGDRKRVTAALDFGRDHLGSTMQESQEEALAKLLNSHDDRFRFLMHSASKGGHADIVHELIRCGALVNSQVGECLNTIIIHKIVVLYM